MGAKKIVSVIVIGGLVVGAAVLAVVQAGGILPPEKQALEDQIKKDIETGKQKAVPKPPATGLLPVRPEAWPSGIFDRKDISVPFKSTQYDIKNVWQKDINGEHVQVYAGALGEDPSQGVVVIITTSLDLQKVDQKRFLTPLKEGAVKILQEDNQKLTLQTANGKSLIFDVASRSFLQQ